MPRVAVVRDDVDVIGDLLGCCPDCRRIIRRYMAQFPHKTLRDFVRNDLQTRVYPWPHARGCPVRPEMSRRAVPED